MIEDLDYLNLELVAVKIIISNIHFVVISYYNPPNTALSRSLFTTLSSNKKFKNLIILGDLNAKVKFFHTTSNQNGEIFEEFMFENDYLLLNNSSVTHKSFHGNSESVLDLVLCSKNFYKYFDQFKVLNEWQMASDHIPIEIKFKSASDKLVLNNVNGAFNS